jgi:hypothetical protein
MRATVCIAVGVDASWFDRKKGDVTVGKDSEVMKLGARSLLNSQ